MFNNREAYLRGSVSSVALSCPTLCDPVDCSTPGFPILHHLLEFAQTQTPVHWVSDTIPPSHPVTPFSSCPQTFPASGSFPLSQFFPSGGQSIGASASAPVPPVNIQVWFPLRLTGLISFLSKGLSRVFFSTTVDLCFPSDQNQRSSSLERYHPAAGAGEVSLFWLVWLSQRPPESRNMETPKEAGDTD